MNLDQATQPEAKSLIRIGFLKVIRGVLIKDRARLLGLALLFIISSALIYQLSTGLVEKTAYQNVTNPDSILYFRLILLLTPIFIGILVGVPLLASDYENGVYRFLFTQGVGRRRLFRATLFMYFTLFIIGTSIMALSVSHFYRVQQQAGLVSKWSLAVFFLQPIILLPLVLAAFSSGVFIGSWIRRTVAGMATALAVYAITGWGLSTLFDRSLTIIARSEASKDPSHFVQLQVLYGALFLLITLIAIVGTLHQIGGRVATSRGENS
jgi:hypothetical protein